MNNSLDYPSPTLPLTASNIRNDEAIFHANDPAIKMASSAEKAFSQGRCPHSVSVTELMYAKQIKGFEQSSQRDASWLANCTIGGFVP